MDQKRIGAFIAQCRKEKNLTQMQLAELLEITKQAVSKWENGRGMPDVSLLQPLCNILDISLNELFSAEHISTEEYKGKAEENISKLYKEKQMADLKPVKYLCSMCTNSFFYVIVIELIVGLVGYFFSEGILEAMFWNILVWFILFIISLSIYTYDKNQLKKLKNFGICMEAEIKELIPASWIRIGNYNTGRVECIYAYEGKEYHARSNYYVLSPFLTKENLYANIYIDSNEPSKCSIELLQRH